jgi:hypothetical protein
MYNAHVDIEVICQLLFQQFFLFLNENSQSNTTQLHLPFVRAQYWDEPLVHDDFENMFENDEWLLINELANLPQSCAERKVNEIVKRIRIIKVHVCILSYLKHQMPRWFGKKKTQEALISDLEQIFDIVRIEYNLSVGDFPDVKDFRQCLADVEDFSSFMSADSKTLKVLDDLILTQIPNIMKGSAGITDSNTPRKTLKKRSGKTPRKQGLEIDVSIAEKEENNMGPLMKVSLQLHLDVIITCTLQSIALI